LKILYIEDNRADWVYLGRLVHQIDPSIEILNVTSLNEANEFLKEHSFDLIFLDCFLVDSIDLENTLTFIKTHASFPILLLTGLEDVSSVYKCMQAGAKDFISKSKMNKDHIERWIHYVRAKS